MNSLIQKPEFRRCSMKHLQNVDAYFEDLERYLEEEYDEQGQVINEPLLVMRSVSVEDARQKLDALYDSSPNKTQDSPE